MQVNMHEAKTKLSQLGEKAWQGEKVVIAKAGKPYLELVPLREGRRKRTPGRLAGKITIADDFDATAPEVVASFEGQE
jgi:antitoxin (DNA-binding transcriptional repressor) of toxin-antitoxin stability system